jgi:putative transposon-encoded protein
MGVGFKGLFIREAILKSRIEHSFKQRLTHRGSTAKFK